MLQPISRPKLPGDPPKRNRKKPRREGPSADAIVRLLAALLYLFAALLT